MIACRSAATGGHPVCLDDVAHHGVEGIGPAVLSRVAEICGGVLKAVIREDNAASQKAFARAGFAREALMTASAVAEKAQETSRTLNGRG